MQTFVCSEPLPGERALSFSHKIILNFIKVRKHLQGHLCNGPMTLAWTRLALCATLGHKQLFRRIGEGMSQVERSLTGSDFTAHTDFHAPLPYP